MRINGYAVPVKDIVTIGAAVFWLATLSFQVNSNAEDIDEQSDTAVRLSSLEQSEDTTKDDIQEIKVAQGKLVDEQVVQGKILVRILEKVSEN